MKKVYLELTLDQRNRDIVFSSTLSIDKRENPSDKIHEIKKDDKEQQKTIVRLLNDTFFENSPWNYNIIRQ